MILSGGLVWCAFAGGVSVARGEQPRVLLGQDGRGDGAAQAGRTRTQGARAGKPSPATPASTSPIHFVCHMMITSSHDDVN
jgi:hypothetical protein